MRKALFAITLLTCFGSFAQHEVSKKINTLLNQNVTFKEYSMLSVVDRNPESQIKNVVDKATFATLKTEILSSLITNNDEQIEVSIPYNGSTVVVQLYKANLFAEGFHLDSDQNRSIAYNPGLYYRGIVKGDNESVAAFSFFKNEMIGMVSSRPLNNLVIGKLDRANNTSDYIIYSDADMNVKNDFECHTEDTATDEPQSDNRILEPQSTKCVTMYFEIDHNLYISNGRNTTTTTNWMTAVFNNVQTLYNNDNITVALKSIYIWTTPDNYSGATSADYLNMFRSVRPAFDGDVGQLIGIDSSGLGGVAATVDGLCSVNNYSYSDVNFSYNTVPTYSWTIMVITHEFGHLLGSPHTHACVWNGNDTPIDSCGPSSIGPTGEGYACMTTPPLLPSNTVKGSIMSYCHLLNIGINLANGFGPQPAARIFQNVNSSFCLSTDCINTCINTASNFSVLFEGNEATITWQQAGNMNWEISVTPYSGLTTEWIPVSTPSYTASNLTPNTYYRVQVRPVCENDLRTITLHYIFLTGAEYCNGIVITDVGGVGGNYLNNQDYVRVMMPNIPNKKIRLSFSSFFLELGDYLTIYNGNSTAAPDLTNGGLSGNIIPNPYESTAADGSLTLKFTSNSSIVRTGFVAAVSCTDFLGTNAIEPNINFSYSPNPTNGLVSIHSITAITAITVYNSIGQLLYQNKESTHETKVDMTAFTTGTYFFKLKFDGREANFKIIKN